MKCQTLLNCAIALHSSKESRRVADGTPLHIYYVFSSRLLASCSVRAASRREAMTERCGLAAELFYSVGSTTGDL
ncbi:hypothetical protein [Nostoc sp.]|uniref:hypothetical protein n=1 Tax=Nostoc sp. TaxID=1180 RepID=UPI002FF7EB28